MTNADTLELIHNKAEDLRRKQDGKLQRLLRLATAIPVVVLSAGTVAVAVSEDLATPAAVVVFGAAIALGVVLFAAEAFAAGWREGPGINDLLAVFQDRRLTKQQFHLVMIITLRDDHTRNGKILNSVMGFVVIQSLVTFAGLVILLLRFQELL